MSIPYRDLSDRDEEERIAFIARHVRTRGGLAAVVVNDAAAAARYAEKLTAAGVKVVDTFAGPVGACWTLRVSRPQGDA